MSLVSLKKKIVTFLAILNHWAIQITHGTSQMAPITCGTYLMLYFTQCGSIDFFLVVQKHLKEPTIKTGIVLFQNIVNR